MCCTHKVERFTYRFFFFIFQNNSSTICFLIQVQNNIAAVSDKFIIVSYNNYCESE